MLLLLPPPLPRSTNRQVHFQTITHKIIRFLADNLIDETNIQSDISEFRLQGVALFLCRVSQVSLAAASDNTRSRRARHQNAPFPLFRRSPFARVLHNNARFHEAGSFTRPILTANIFLQASG